MRNHIQISLSAILFAMAITNADAVYAANATENEGPQSREEQIEYHRARAQAQQNNPPAAAPAPSYRPEPTTQSHQRREIERPDFARAPSNDAHKSRQYRPPQNTERTQETPSFTFNRPAPPRRPLENDAPNPPDIAPQRHSNGTIFEHRNSPDQRRFEKPEFVQAPNSPPIDTNSDSSHGQHTPPPVGSQPAPANPTNGGNTWTGRFVHKNDRHQATNHANERHYNNYFNDYYDRSGRNSPPRSSNWSYNFGPNYAWEFSQARGWQSYNSPRYSRSDNFHQYDRPSFDFRAHSGHNFMGPYGNWNRWDNSWGDANMWARRWGFDAYDPYRGWQRGRNWYSHPSQWQDWGGWFSFNLGSNGLWGYSYDNYSNFSGNNYYNQYGSNCMRLSTREYYRGDTAIISFIACQNSWGNWVEVPRTRQFEYWAR